MSIFNIFKKSQDTKINEYNSLYTASMLGNNLLSQATTKTNFFAGLISKSSQTNAGNIVDIQSAIQNSTLLTCVALKARLLGQLPVKVMMKDTDGKLVDPLYAPSALKYKKVAKKINRLFKRPTNYTNTYDLLAQIMLHYDLFGQAFINIKRINDDDINSEIIGLTCLNPTLISPMETTSGYAAYRLSTPSGKEDNILSYFNVCHIKELPYHGDSSLQKYTLSPELLAEDIGIDRLANFYLTNSPKMSLILTPKDSVADLDAGKSSQQKWIETLARIKEQASSLEQPDPNAKMQTKAGGLLALPMGVDLQRVPLPNIQDADLAKLKEQTTARICALTGIPVQMLGLSESKFNNVSALTSEVYKSTMSPIIKNIEQALTLQLLYDYDDILFIVFDTSEFIHGDEQALLSNAVAGLNAGLYTPNEARALMGLPSLPGEENDKLRNAQPMNTNSMINKADTSPQSTGGGGGSALGVPKINIGQSDANS